MRTNNHVRKTKIQDALDLLNEAAQEKKDEMFEMISGKYDSLREVFESAMETGGEMAENARRQAVRGLHAEEKKIRQAAAEVEKKVRRNPWKVLGGVALGALTAGLLLARRK